MPNRLAQETSPYLLQHSDNPVDWYPWGKKALALAYSEQKPIFLSIGYSACHWCHVMEHESFEDEQIAAALNRDFVCIKVDREERPDLDQLYMTAVQLLTGRGGWPMSVFLTPEMQPFYGGTYWPPRGRQGSPGFDQVLSAVSEAWEERPDQAVAQAERLTEGIRRAGIGPPSDEFTLAHAAQLTEAATQLEQTFDFTHGGFGTAPKFPQAMNLQVLLRLWHRTRRQGLIEMIRLNLDKLAAGGIYDQLAGGFARYAVDERWLVPHFEKMLYDNALLSGAFLDGYVATGDSQDARVARETFDYVLNYMTDPAGGFHSTEDADSEGVEGKFYVWSPDEVRAVLGDELGGKFCSIYDVSEQGNFEGRSILNLPQSLTQRARQRGEAPDELAAEMQRARQQLLTARDQRVRPAKDDKVLVSWNGLMIDSMARGGRVLRDSRYTAAAAGAAEFLLTQLQPEPGRLLHCWRAGRARFAAYLDDYACLANGLVTLYEATFDERWIDHAMQLVATIRTRFGDPEGHGYFFTADDHEELIARQKDLYDSSVPSGNGMTATVLTRLGKLCGRADFLADARGILDLAAPIMTNSPTAAGQALIALDMQTGPLWEIAVLGNPDGSDTSVALDDFWQRFIPNRVIACRQQAEQEDGSIYLDPIFAGRTPLYGEPSVFVCRKFACDSPVSGRVAACGKWGELVAGGQQMPREGTQQGFQ